MQTRPAPSFTLIAFTSLALALSLASCKRSDPNPPPTSGRLEGSPGAPPAGTPPRLTLPPPAAPKKRSPDDYGSYACRLMKGCYTKHQAFGQVAGRITVTVGADGKATAAAYDNGTAPGPVKECIVTSGKLINIPGFDAGAGDLSCDYSGQLMAGGMEIMSKSWKFIAAKGKAPTPLPAAPAPPPAAPAPAK